MPILMLIIMIMPFEFNPYLVLTDSLLGFPQFTAIKLLGLIGLGWVTLELASGRASLRLGQAPQLRALGLYLAIALVCGLTRASGLLVVSNFLSLCALMPLVLVAVTDEHKLRATIKTCVVTMMVVYVYAVRQMGRYNGPLGTGLNDVNYFALMLVLVLPLPFAYAGSAPTKRSRILWLMAGMVLIAEIIQTGSRGGFLALAAVAVVVGLRLSRRPLLTVGGMVGAVIVLIAVLPTPLVSRLVATTDEEHVFRTGVQRSNEARMIAIDAGLRMIADSPLTGVGAGNFGTYKRMWAEAFPEGPNLAHNTYLELAAELGLPALAAFLFIIGRAFRSLRRAERAAAAAGRETLARTAIAVQASLVGYLVGAFFLSAQYDNFFWLIMFLSVCIERIAASAVVPDVSPAIAAGPVGLRWAR
jgi:putative inorganic carbon (HCO3(-)) transporter